MMNYKKGSSLIVMPIIFIICVVFLVLIGYLFINVIKPFIIEQKINKIANKYMFVIEKFGYLTNSEKNNLINDLKSNGIDISNVSITVPTSKKNYGELLTLKIIYKAFYDKISIEGFKINIIKNNVNIQVEKNGYSKI